MCTHIHCTVYVEQDTYFYISTLGVTRYGDNVGTSGQTISYPGEGPREEEQVKTFTAYSIIPDVSLSLS